jgi:uncharacterized protein involved in oxidation of intracellular sulfur
MSNVLIILNDPPYGSERTYNGLRLAGALVRHSPGTVKLFLLGDAVSCAKSGQQVPQGFYNVEVMLHALSGGNAEVGVCGTCMAARAIADGDLAPGTRSSTMDELANWAQWADKVLVF